MYNRRRVIYELHSVGKPHTCASATVPGTLHFESYRTR